MKRTGDTKATKNNTNFLCQLLFILVDDLLHSIDQLRDATLKMDFQNGSSVKQLSKTLGRHEGSIKMRLQKHFGEDVSL